MRVGVLATGDIGVRAAHALAASPIVESVVVVGPARSKNFTVVESADECDLLVGSGPQSPDKAMRLGKPLVWDGNESPEGVAVYAANPAGLLLAAAARETEPRLLAVALPDYSEGSEMIANMPAPVGDCKVTSQILGGRTIAIGKSDNEFGAILIRAEGRNVAIVDHAGFMSGVCLAAGVAVFSDTPLPVWDDALDYLETVVEMGLVMAEERLD